MKHLRFVSLFLALFFIVLGLGCSGKAESRQMPVDSQRVVSLMDSVGIPSMQLCLHEKSGTYPTLLLKADSNSIFQAASLSKPVFSYIVMKLVDKGLMNLDTPVASYTDIDRFEDKEMASKITPRMVLSHTSGLYNWAFSPTAEEWDTSRISFHFAADECYGYSGEAYAFLQRAVEHLTGKSLNELAVEFVFKPFGMPLSCYQWREEYDELAVCGYNREGQDKGRWEGIKPNCAYTLRTNASEYMNFLVHAVLNGEGLSAQTYKEWLTPRSHAIRFKGKDRACDKDMYWCLGMGVKVSYDKDGKPVPQQYWHWGDNDYWKSLYVVDIHSQQIMTYFTNSAAGHDICNEVCKMSLGQSYGIQEWIGEEDDE